MLVFPNAKINIGLRILRKRADGYHDIESLFYPVGLSDILEILPAGPDLNDPESDLSVSGLNLDAGRDNLCLRAAELFREKHGGGAFRMHLHKIIPMGSGLGGGSSDAAFTLMAINELTGSDLQETTLSEYAAAIGSDCPFFILNRACLVKGRGEIIEPASLSLSGYYLVILFPGISVPTAEAYSMIHPSEEGIPVEEYIHQDIRKWKNLSGNQFEEAIFRKYPLIAEARDLLYRKGAVFASMTGSGSAVFGLFDSEPGKEFGTFSYYSEILR